MTLYIVISAWLLALLLLGLRPDSILIAESWPKLPEDKRVRRNHYIVSILVFATFLFLWFLTAFRSSVIGRDTQNYLGMFYAFANGGAKRLSFEIGFETFNIVLSKFTRNPHVFLIICATLLYSGVGIYLFFFSKNPAISLCLFFCCFFSCFTSMIRQGMAMVIVLFAYQLIKNGKKIPAALLILLASTLHVSALVCFLLFFDFKILGKWWFVFGLTAFCAVISRFGIFKLAVGLIAPKYVHYFNTKYASTGWLAITYYLLTYAVMYYFVSKSIIEDYKPDRTVTVNYALLVILIAFGYAINIFDRVCDYFLLIGITELPNMLYRGKVKHFRLWLFCICAVLLIMFNVILYYRPTWSHIYPYEFWPDSIFAALN